MAEEANKPRATRRCFHAMNTLVAVVLAVLCCVGVVLRCTVRDGFQPLATVYYALPLPVLAVFAMVVSLAFFRRRHAKWAYVFVVVAACCGVSWYQAGFATNDHEPTSDSIDVLFWNTARGVRGWPEIADELRRFDAPIIGLVEAGRNDETMNRFWKREFPNREVAVHDGGIVVLVKGEIVKSTTGPLGDRSDYVMLDVRVNGRAITVIVVDIISTPWWPRETALNALAALVERRNDRPVIVMGDFNTPPDSVHFNALQRSCRNAFETAGDGYAATWPTPAPVLSLDQIWANKTVRISRCEHLWSTRSDHRPVRATVVTGLRD